MTDVNSRLVRTVSPFSLRHSQWAAISTVRDRYTGSAQAPSSAGSSAMISFLPPISRLFSLVTGATKQFTQRHNKEGGGGSKQSGAIRKVKTVRASVRIFTRKPPVCEALRLLLNPTL